MERESFIFYVSFFEAIKELPNDSQLKVYQAITNFALKGIEPTNLNGIEKAVFILIKPQILANNTRYKNGCSGGEFGYLGGRPKKKTKTPKKPLKNPKETPNVNDNVNENVNDNENVNKKDSKGNVPKALPSKFVKPSKQELKDFAIQEQLTETIIDEFFDYYDSNGWKVGRNPMKDWKATYRRWCRNQPETKEQLQERERKRKEEETMRRVLENVKKRREEEQKWNTQ